MRQDHATHRGTMLGGRLDCFVLEGGVPVVTPGRIAPVEHAAFVKDLIAAATEPVGFLDKSEALHFGATSDSFIDALVGYCADSSKPLEMRQLGRAWLRDFAMRGIVEARP